MRTIKPVLCGLKIRFTTVDRSTLTCIAHHAIRDWVNERHIAVRYVKSADQLADVLTKALPKDVHRRMMYLVMGNNPNIVQDSQKLADILPDRLYDARADSLFTLAVG